MPPGTMAFVTFVGQVSPSALALIKHGSSMFLQPWDLLSTAGLLASQAHLEDAFWGKCQTQ